MVRVRKSIVLYSDFATRLNHYNLTIDFTILMAMPRHCIMAGCDTIGVKVATSNDGEATRNSH